MKRFIPRSFRNFLALILCVSMLLPMVTISGAATETTEPTVEVMPVETTAQTVETTDEESTDIPAEVATDATPMESMTETTEAPVVAASDDLIDAQADDGTFTILAGSDFQAYGSSAEAADAAATANMNAILKQVKKHHSIEAFLFGGDYNSVVYGDHKDAATYSTQGFNKLTKVLADNGLSDVPKFFVQGNHDPAGLSFVTPTGGYNNVAFGGYDSNMFGVYILNNADYMDETQDEAKVQATATGLETWLARTLAKSPSSSSPMFPCTSPCGHGTRATPSMPSTWWMC